MGYAALKQTIGAVVTLINPACALVGIDVTLVAASAADAAVVMAALPVICRAIARVVIVAAAVIAKYDTQ